MSLESDVQYWENRNWDILNQQNQIIAQNFEKAKRTYSQAIKEGIVVEDNLNLAFKFTARKWTKTSFTIDEIVRALIHTELIDPGEKEIIKEELTNVLAAMNPTKEAYYLKFR